jgi:lysozyme
MAKSKRKKSSRKQGVMIALLSAAGLLLVLMAVWLWPKGTPDPGPPPEVTTFGIVMPKGYSIHGIDVSKHQGRIDWQRISRMQENGIRISFVFIKATEGITRQDDQFKENWQKAAEAGLIRGAYHFYYPSRDAAKQAANLIKMLRLKPGDLPPVVDVETSNGRSSGQIQKGLKQFLGILEKKYGVKPILYTNTSFYKRFLSGSFDSYPLWIAGYYDHERFYSEFNVPWSFWQHSESGRADGIRGKVDFNVFRGNRAKLDSLRVK